MITTPKPTGSIRAEDLQSLDFADIADGDLEPVSPGEILVHEFLEPLGMTPGHLAKAIGVQQERIRAILAGRRAISADTGLRLSRFFGMSDAFWIGLQADYDAAKVRSEIADELARIQPLDKIA